MLRTHHCNEIRAVMAGEMVILCGWVHSVRPHGNVVFVDLRDRYGMTQLVFAEELKEKALRLKKESVIMAKGVVKARTEVNKLLSTGDAELDARDLKIFSESDKVPLDMVDETSSSEDIRLKYRYLDLRRSPMKKNILTRAKIVKAIRDFYEKHDFLEIETPFLTRSTPEGARDYLVPSRVYHGSFFALPQSPQIYKQLLMVSGMDRYFQIVRCFRDEDLRADRQPEFTQLDVEMSFITEEDIFSLHEELVKELFKKILHKDITTPFLRMTYDEAMQRYGSDKPDLRLALELIDVSNMVKDAGFKVFSDAIAGGGSVVGLRAQGCCAFSRKEIDEMTELAKTHGAGGLVAWKVSDTGELDGPGSKFVEKGLQQMIIGEMESAAGDLLLLVADKRTPIAQKALGEVRLHLGRKQKMIDESAFAFCWVIDFPLIEWNEEDKKYVAMHHPFTSPKESDIRLLGDGANATPEHAVQARARAYDLVLNGSEIAGGSIRIHERTLQEKMFSVLGIGKEEAEQKFGFLLDAFRYGAPPHGGIAFGLDRLCAIMTGNASIREVIAFPKNKHCVAMLENAPAPVDKKQLDELGIALNK